MRGVENPQVREKSGDFADCREIECGVCRDDLTLLSSLPIVCEQTKPPVDAVASVLVPEMDFFTGGEGYLGMPGKVSVDPGGTRFLRADPQKIDHVEFTTSLSG